jgi:hypothetical protein
MLLALCSIGCSVHDMLQIDSLEITLPAMAGKEVANDNDSRKKTNGSL